MSGVRQFAWAGALLALLVGPGHAALQVIGDGITGDVDVADGTTLWSLIQNVQTPVAPGYNAKNAILHNYVIATSADGAVSVFSAGELDPSFGGTNAAPYIGVSGGAYALIDPNAGASGRDLADLSSLTVVAAPAEPNGPGGVSSSFALTGLVTSPGTYASADLPSPPPVPASATADGGEQFYAFLDPASSSVTRDIVVTAATDGYLVVFSLAELDPALGGDPGDLLAYVGPSFPADGLARIVTPDDNKHGRWNSNLDFVDVAAVPEAPTWAMILFGFAGLGLAVRHSGCRLRAALRTRPASDGRA